MKIDISKYKISLDKDVKVRMAMFSDIHYSKKFDLSVLDTILEHCDKEKFDYIVIPGGLINDTLVIDDKDNINYFTEWIKKLASTSKVIFSIGNHDTGIMRLKNGKTELVNDFRSLSYFNKLNNIPNVYWLNNESKKIDNIIFSGYTPRDMYKYYENGNNDNSDYFINVMNNEMKKGSKELLLDNPNLLHFTLVHDPDNVYRDEVIKEVPILENSDVIVSGHNHNGMLPSNWFKVFDKSNRGVVNAQMKLFAPYCGGTVVRSINDKYIYGIISGAVTKLSDAASFMGFKLNKLNKLYKPNFYEININNDVDKNKVKKLSL